MDRNCGKCGRPMTGVVALRKESVDRNYRVQEVLKVKKTSLSARRAWIEITQCRL